MRESWLCGVAENPAAPVEILLRLLRDDTRDAWQTLCEQRDLPQAVIDAVVVHPDQQIARHFVRNERVDPWQLARLLDGPHHLRARTGLVIHRRRFRPLPDDLIL